MEGLTAVGLVLAGGLVGLGTAYVQRHWTKQDARSTKIEDRALEAAANILDQLGRAVRLVRDSRATAASADDAMHDICNEIERHSTLLADASLRKWISKMTLVLWHFAYLKTQPSGESVSITHVVLIAGQQLLGAYQRGEPLPTSTLQLDKVNELWADAVELERLIERTSKRPSMVDDT